MAVPRGITDSTPTGTKLDAVALNAAEASRQFVVNVGGWSNLTLLLAYTHNNDGTITVLIEGADDIDGTNVYSMTTGQTTSGATTLSFVTGATTGTLTADKKYTVRMDVKGHAFARVTVTHNGSADASDIITCTGYLTA